MKMCYWNVGSACKWPANGLSSLLKKNTKQRNTKKGVKHIQQFTSLSKGKSQLLTKIIN